jgi:hypothetical protein
MSDTATNGAAPIDLGFIDPFNTELVKEPVKVVNGNEPGNETAKPAAVAEPAKPAPAAEPPKDEEDIFDEVQYVKNNFGWDSAEAGKAELQRLRDLEKKPVTFANEQSEKAFNYLKEGKEVELRDLLDRKIKLSKADALEAKNAIGLHLQVTNEHYTPQDIEDILEERYPMPKKPEQGKEEEQVDYDARLTEYSQTLEKINRRINRDSLQAKEDLKKLHSEFILPDINRIDPAQAQDAAQKELDAKKARERYLAHIESDTDKAVGFKTTVKDKEVEIPLSYDFTPEERLAYKEKLKTFDLHTFFGPRWFAEDGTPRVERIISDLYLLENEEKVIQKFSNDGASKRMDAYLKDKKNIKLNGNQNEGTFNPSNKEATEKALGEWAFAQ